MQIAGKTFVVTGGRSGLGEATAAMLEREGAALDGASVGRSIGEGLDIRLAGHRIAGSALVRRGHVIHAELFRVAA